MKQLFLFTVLDMLAVQTKHRIIHGYLQMKLQKNPLFMMLLNFFTIKRKPFSLHHHHLHVMHINLKNPSFFPFSPSFNFFVPEKVTKIKKKKSSISSIFPSIQGGILKSDYTNPPTIGTILPSYSHTLHTHKAHSEA